MKIRGLFLCALVYLTLVWSPLGSRGGLVPARGAVPSSSPASSARAADAHTPQITSTAE